MSDNNTETKLRPGPDHMGDGVYINYLGWALAFSVNDHNATPCLFMDPSVLNATIRYAVRAGMLDERILQYV